MISKDVSKIGLAIWACLLVIAASAQKTNSPGNSTNQPTTYPDKVVAIDEGIKMMKAVDFAHQGTQFYVDQKLWLAINPAKNKEASVATPFPYESGVYDLLLLAVGESDGKSEFTVSVNDVEVMNYYAPQSKNSFEEGPQYNDLRENVALKKGDIVKVTAKVGTIDGKEFSRGRWSGLAFVPVTNGKDVLVKLKASGTSGQQSGKRLEPNLKFSDVNQRLPNGNGQVKMEGELKQWHKVTLTLDGAFAHELDKAPNPFTDYRMTVSFRHESGSPNYTVPAYFAADGNAGNTGADRGTKWRAHLSPDKAGKWLYSISFLQGKNVAVSNSTGVPVMPYDGKTGSFTVAATDKKGVDFRSKGRLEYVGKHHLQFKGNKEYFMKAGADAPETLLGFEDFDGTYTLKVPLKKFQPHLNDYKTGDATWMNGKGKGLIGAINYLSEKGTNAVSFLTYNAGGDGDNVWPFVKRSEKFHYDCSKLDQWGIVFDHAQSKGLFLHFKTQENETDDNTRGAKKDTIIIESLDGGDLGPERQLYYRELIARYGYLLALNWNLGEENTQSVQQRKDMASYFHKNDPYRHMVVLHTFPGQRDAVYGPLLGKNSDLTGVSLQNNWNKTHEKTRYWVKASDSAGVKWVVANDEQGSASQGVPPDPGYKGFDAQKIGYDLHDIRKQTLWANIMAWGAGVEYYFGYTLPENDLLLEDFRSRDRSWDYCRHAVQFFQTYPVPFWQMTNRNDLIDNPTGAKEKYCLAKEGECYLVYLAYAATSSLDLSLAKGTYNVQWYNPRSGGALLSGSVKTVNGGGVVQLGNAPGNAGEDWLVIVRKK
jgi:hypothetical protein